MLLVDCDAQNHVADCRRRLYANSMSYLQHKCCSGVGCPAHALPLFAISCFTTGTYVFRLNDSFLVDATRAGNIAHLINHSCAPCCVSKTYTIQDPCSGQKKDHVVIVAKRDIAVGMSYVSVLHTAANKHPQAAPILL